MREPKGELGASHSYPGKIAFLLLAYLLVCSVTSARADAILRTGAQICRDSNGISDPRDPAIVANCFFTGGTGTTSASDTRHIEFDSGLPGITSIFDASASGSADFGTLNAFASLTVENYRAGSYEASLGANFPFPAAGSAEFEDTWEVFGGTINSGFLELTFSGTGSISSSIPGFALALLILTPTVNFQINGDFTETLLLPFTAGTPLDISVILSAVIGPRDFSFPDPYNYSGTADASNTATLSNILVTDEFGIPIPGARINTASETDYPLSPLNAAPVPEPATLTLLGSGLAALAAFRRRTRRPA